VAITHDSTSADFEQRGRVASQRNVRAVNVVDARITARSSMDGLDNHSWYKAKLHQSLGKCLGQVDPIDRRSLTQRQIDKTAAAFETHLQFLMYNQV
jgi:hypothetical protein